MTLHTPFSAYGWFTAALASRLALRATASGGFGDDNGVGFGKRLQPGGQVRCFADHSRFPRRYPIRADRRPPPVQWRDRPPFATAFDEIETSQRRNMEVRLTHRWRGESRANQSLKRGFRGRGNYGPIPRRLWDDAGSINGAISGARRPKFGLVSLGCLLLRCRFKSLKMLLFCRRQV